MSYIPKALYTFCMHGYGSWINIWINMSAVNLYKYNILIHSHFTQKTNGNNEISNLEGDLTSVLSHTHSLGHTRILCVKFCWYLWYRRTGLCSHFHSDIVLSTLHVSNKPYKNHSSKHVEQNNNISNSGSRTHVLSTSDDYDTENE